MKEKTLGQIHSFDKILKISRDTRRWALKYKNKRSDYFKHGLAGMCGIASTELHLRLNRAGISNKICVGEAHVFIQTHNYLLDITACQFGYEPILLIKIGSKAHRDLLSDKREYHDSLIPTYKFCHWKRAKVFTQLDDFLEFLHTSNWPVEQIWSPK